MNRKRLPSLLLPTLLMLSACLQQPAPVPSPEVIVPDTTEVLTPAAQASLLEFAADGTLRFLDPTLLASLDPGDVVVSGPTAAAPAGMLRRVVSLREDAGELLVATEPAVLEDAIYQGEAQAEGDLGPAELAAFEPALAGVRLVDPLSPQASLSLSFNEVISDADGNHATTDDQVRAQGSVNLGFGYEIGLGFKAGLSFPTVVDISTRIRAVFYLNQTNDLDLIAGKAASFNESVDIGTFTFSPIVFTIGPVPVVVVPVLRVILFADGQVGAEISFGASEQLGVTVGFEKPYGGGFAPIASISPSASAHPPSLDPSQFGASFSARAGLEVRGAMKFYGVAGPYMTVEPYLRLKGKIPGSPAWELHGGIAAEVGLWVDLFVFEFDWGKKVFDESFLIAEANANNPPTIKTVVPNSGSTVQVGKPVQFSSYAVDLEDGQIFGATFDSNLDGALNLDGLKSYTFLTAGTRTITVTVTDSGGATATRTLTLHVVNTPPAVTIGQPHTATEVYRGVPVILFGSASDPNENGEVIACSLMTWTSSDPADSMPTSACADPLTATFPTTGIRTLTLTALDQHGGSGSASVTVTVVEPPAGNLPPQPAILEPAAGATFTDVYGLAVKGRAFDPDGSGLIYRWSIEWDGGSAEIEAGIVQGTNEPGGALLEAFWSPYPCLGTMTSSPQRAEG